ncbi:flagellar export protein FliJ [Marinimicrobium agarilyticum]|uniref:flagellar export protein FliJ n=1 Tax=Marinimicrobium agarilyticum TaxID=306546 RepID=UPI000429A5E4|nr:flagellar export protein FliJ [Marinimicrobium agarilyticum]
MAERRSQRMKVVLQLAEREEQAAAARLGEQQQLLEREQAQLSQLQDYRQQYLDDYARPRSGVTAEALMSYSGFLQRLGEAVTGQQQKLAMVNQAREQSRREWEERYHRRRSLEDMIARLQREEEAAFEQRQQREQDDLAAQRLTRPGRSRKP